MRNLAASLLIALCVVGILASCTREAVPPWSKVEPWKDGSRKSIGTPGLALSIGASRKIEFEFGPSASFIAPPTPESERDAELIAGSVPPWTLERNDTRIVLPVESTDQVKVRGYNENVDTEIWNMLISSGCATLTAAVRADFSPTSAIIQRKYRLCGIKEAAARLASDG